ncbi:MAG: ComF family protein [Pseudomonadota bacterium]
MLSPLLRRGAARRRPLPLRPILPAVLAALLPMACPLCALPCRALLCAPCQARFFGPGAARCAQCANRLPDGPIGEQDGQASRCGRCLSHPPAYDATVVAVDYGVPIDQLVLQLKFGARLALAGLFAQLLRDAVLERPGLALPELLCPVPLGPRRLAERGFNQALEIARPLSRRLGIPLSATLACRVHDTAAQSRLAPAERRRNVERAFLVAPHALSMVRGRHIGVVDDVMTSGQTLHHLAATLKRFGATRVTNLVFARTPPR